MPESEKIISHRGGTENYNTLMQSFKESVGFVNHQIASFNEFVDVRVQKIIDDLGEIELETPELAEFKIKLGKVRIPKPTVKEADGAVRQITPFEARTRDLTYASPILVEMIPIINGVEQEPQEIKLGEIPVMLKSNRCVLNGLARDELVELGEDPDDPGGYFIINGTERVIVMVEEVLSNRSVIQKKGELETARINSEVGGFVQRHILERKNNIVTISFANLTKLPLVVLLKALGVETDREIIEVCGVSGDEVQDIYFNLYEFDIKNADDAKDYIGKRLRIPQKEYREKRVNDILDKYLLPHLGQDKKFRKEKAQYLAKVMKKLLRLGAEDIREQDIDHYANKRIRLVGDFLEILFRSILLGKYGLMSRIIYSYQKLVGRGKMPSIKSIVESDYLTKRIVSHMATGQWVGGRTGVCQRLERTNFIRTITHLRNVISPLSSAQEHFEARALHPTHWGRLCCEETPEGVNIGLRKYLAIMAVISPSADAASRMMLLDMVKREEPGTCTVFLDGRVIGTTAKPDELVEKVRKKRRIGAINPHVGIAYTREFEEIYMNADSGRLQRPLVVLDSGKPRLTQAHLEKLARREATWFDVLKEGVIEYLDAEEEDNMLVALSGSSVSKAHTHVEIDNGIILGIAASLVPFAPHNRGDRVNFGAKMYGQSLGVFATNFLQRTDTKSDVLLYPQVPLVNTMAGTKVDLHTHPQGQNIVIAVMSYDGYNMEDGIVFNKASIERGFGRSVFFRSYTIEEKKYWGIEKDEIRIPDKTVSGYRSEEAYANLSEDGIINKEIEVVGGDVLVGKVSPLRFFGPVETFMTDMENRRETSETIRHDEEGIVDEVILSETINGNKIVKVRVRSMRVPELGDKFASRHGQKGVISLVVPEENMPFTSQGVTPDIILNPHAIPSRMTIGQLLEIIAAKYSALSGTYVDASAFSYGEDFEREIRNALEKTGFSNDGKEIMYHGVTGRRMEATILMGPCYYQKLHHMVANKLQARARGPVALLTKQPTAGRAKQGGLRLGEMEKDCLLAHGAALLLKERFSSDKFSIPVCTTCGLVAVDDKIRGKRYCSVCKKSDIIDVDMSYSFKLMLDELKCLGIYPKVRAA